MLPDLTKRWVTPWIAIDWTKRAARGLLYHFVRDFGLTFGMSAIAFLFGEPALAFLAPIVVAWGAILFEVGQGVMKFERHGEIHDGFLDPIDVLFTPLAAGLALLLANIIFLVVEFYWAGLVISYGLYLALLIPILAINLYRGTPPELLTEE